jgi:hypothetical protein
MNSESRIFSPLKTWKPRNLRFYFSVMIILSFFSMQMAGCGGAKYLPPYPAKAFNSYSNQAAKNDLKIAIQPMTDKEAQETYFGVVLTDVGILPVYVIAENRNASHRFMLRDDHILLRNKITNDTYPKPLITDAADDSHLEGAKRTSLIAGNILLSAPLIFTSLGFARNSEKVKSIQDNMFDKTLFTQTISPGKTASGFAYFKIADDKIDISSINNMIKNLVLAIQVTDEGTQSACDFQFDLP